MDVTQTVLALLATQPRDDGLHGTGVGAVTYRGTVRKALSPEEAIATLEPGEVLVVPFTTPAYNVVLPLAGGIVTIGGGPLSPRRRARPRARASPPSSGPAVRWIS